MEVGKKTAVGGVVARHQLDSAKRYLENIWNADVHASPNPSSCHDEAEAEAAFPSSPEQRDASREAMDFVSCPP